MTTWIAHDYQRRAIARGLQSKFQAFFLDPGLGKTTLILQLFRILKNADKVKGMLIIAPLRPCYLVWPIELKKWDNFHDLSFTILHKEYKKIKSLDSSIDIHIINPEGLTWLSEELRHIDQKHWPFNMLVVDESTKFKTFSSVRWKKIKPLLPSFERRYILSGTPTPNSLLDIQPQLALVDLGETFGLKVSPFRLSYFTSFGNPKFPLYKISSKQHADSIYKKASKFITRISSKEAKLKLPMRIDNPIYINLPKKARKHYDQLEQEYFTLVDEVGVFADAEIQKRLKLHQMANGQIYKDVDPLLRTLKKREVLFIHRAKIEALRELREELNYKPLLIGYAFRHDLSALRNEFKKDLVSLSGASMQECRNISNQWNRGEINMLACYPGTAALGLNLQQHGQDVVWYSLVDNWENYHQFILRLERQGSQHECIRNHQLIAYNTIDEVILQNLDTKQKNQIRFLDSVQAYRQRRIGATKSLTRKN